jgi:hypothetical protein
MGWACRKDVEQQNEVWKGVAKLQVVLGDRGIDGKKTCRRMPPYCQIHKTGGKMWDRLGTGNRGGHGIDWGQETGEAMGSTGDRKQVRPWDQLGTGNR